jgi:hypothetical protein
MSFVISDNHTFDCPGYHQFVMTHVHFPAVLALSVTEESQEGVGGWGFDRRRSEIAKVVFANMSHVT